MALRLHTIARTCLCRSPFSSSPASSFLPPLFTRPSTLRWSGFLGLRTYRTKAAVVDGKDKKDLDSVVVAHTQKIIEEMKKQEMQLKGEDVKTTKGKEGEDGKGKLEDGKAGKSVAEGKKTKEGMDTVTQTKGEDGKGGKMDGKEGGKKDTTATTTPKGEEAKESKEVKDSKDGKETKDSKEAKDKETKEKESKDGKDGKEGKEGKEVKAGGKRKEKEEPPQVPYSVNVGEHFRRLPPMVVVGLDVDPKYTGFTFLDHRGHVLGAGCLDVKGIKHNFDKAKYVRNRIEDELIPARDKLRDNLIESAMLRRVRKGRAQEKVEEEVADSMKGLRIVSGIPSLQLVGKTVDEKLLDEANFFSIVGYECFNLFDNKPVLLESETGLLLLDLNKASDRTVFDLLSPLIDQEWPRTAKGDHADPYNFPITNSCLLAHCALLNHLVSTLTSNSDNFYEFRKVYTQWKASLPPSTTPSSSSPSATPSPSSISPFTPPPSPPSIHEITAEFTKTVEKIAGQFYKKYLAEMRAQFPPTPAPAT